MKKELRPIHDAVSCDICGRTMLKGERAETYLVPGGARRLVCDLCMSRAEYEGWLRESAHGDLPTTARRPERRGSLLSRIRRRRSLRAPRRSTPAEGAPAWSDSAGGGAAPSPEPGRRAPSDGESPAAPLLRPVEAAPPAPPEDLYFQGQPARWGAGEEAVSEPRHVRAVPTNAQVKVERALELFNASDHRRTVGGLTRTLGEPWVSAMPVPAAPSEVSVVVAWELSWYHWRIDLGDPGDPVTLLEKGARLAELDRELTEWNGAASPDGSLAAGVGSAL